MRIGVGPCFIVASRFEHDERGIPQKLDGMGERRLQKYSLLAFEGPMNTFACLRMYPLNLSRSVGQEKKDGCFFVIMVPKNSSSLHLAIEERPPTSLIEGLQERSPAVHPSKGWFKDWSEVGWRDNSVHVRRQLVLFRVMTHACRLRGPFQSWVSSRFVGFCWMETERRQQKQGF